MPFIATQSIEDRTSGLRLEFTLDSRTGDTKLNIYNKERTRVVTFVFDVNTGEVEGPARVEAFGFKGEASEPELENAELRSLLEAR